MAGGRRHRRRPQPSPSGTSRRAQPGAARHDPPTLQAFQVDREGQPGVLVLWDHGEAFGGENEPPVTVTWPWPTAAASVTDAFGQTRTVRAGDGQLRLPVSDTPLFVTR